MAESCSALATPNRQAMLRFLCLRGVKVRLEIMDHAIARIAICPQECMVVSNAVQTLADLLLVETLALIARSKRLDRTLFALDILLNVASGSTVSVDFLCRNRYEVIAKQRQDTVLLQHCVHSSDGLDT